LVDIRQTRPKFLLVSRFRHSYPVAAGLFTNVRTKGTPAKLDSSVVLDLTFDLRIRCDTESNVKSTTLIPKQRGSHNAAFGLTKNNPHSFETPWFALVRNGGHDVSP
jgi:hypothetical protein